MANATNAQLDQFAELLKALGHPTRLRIVTLLSHGEAGVSTLYQSLGLPQAVVSQHLILMKDRGILTSRKKGTAVIYSIAESVATAIVGLVGKVGA